MPATYASAEYAAVEVQPSRTERVLPRNAAVGELYHAFVTYALSSGVEEVATDIINLITLPVGAYLVPHMCSVFSADPGTTLTLDVGYAANPDAYADGIVLSAGGEIKFNSATAPSGALAIEPITTGAVYATVNSAGTLTDAVVLSFSLVFKLPN